MRLLLCLIVLVLLAACDVVAPEAPTLTPTRALSGPTIEPSPTVLNLMPTSAIFGTTAPGQTIPEARSIPFNAELPPIVMTPTGDEGFGVSSVQISLGNSEMLVGNLYENPPVELEQGPLRQRLPGVLLIGAPLSAWGDVPAQIRDGGYTVLVVNLPGTATTANFVTVMRAFSETRSVNPGLIAVVGAGEGANLALIGCAVERLCDAAALLSPTARATLLNIIVDYNPRPLLVAASQDDTTAYETALALRDATIGTFSLQEFESAGSGTMILDQQPALVGTIIQWLGRFLIS